MDDFAEPYINKGVFLGGSAFQKYRDVVLAIAPCNALAVNAFDKHTLCLALHRFEIPDFVFHRDLSHDFAAFCFYLFRHLVGHCGGFGAGANGVFEGVDVAEADFASEVAAFLEGDFGLAGEAYDDVGGEVEIGAKSLDAMAHLAELVDGVVTVHPSQGVVGTALQADVHVGSQLLMLE